MPDAGRGILFLDHEGGFGGSSRSLYYLVESMDRERFRPVVAVRKDGPIRRKYAELGVPCVHVPDLPVFRPGERKHAVAFALFLMSLVRFPRVLRTLRALVEEHGVVQLHANHENMALTAGLASRKLGLPWSCHVRVQLNPSVAARLLCGLIARRARRIVFISDPVMTHFMALAGVSYEFDKAAVVWNITPEPDKDLEPRPELLERPEAMHLLSLSNFSPRRGVDRLVDVAAALKDRGRTDFVFHLYGQASNTRVLGGAPSPYFARIRERVRSLGLEEQVLFHGHIADPERALAGGHVLIKLARDACPWGRDLMEAMAFGLPVVALGAYEGVVRHGENGYLALHFDPGDIAAFLIRLRDEPGLLEAMGEANARKAAEAFGGGRNAALAEAVFESVSHDATNGADRT